MPQQLLAAQVIIGIRCYRNFFPVQYTRFRTSRFCTYNLFAGPLAKSAGHGSYCILPNWMTRFSKTAK
jgi:hypothetical protein